MLLKLRILFALIWIKKGYNMSGGFFDYKNYRLNDWACQLEYLIRSNGKEDEYGYKTQFKTETLQTFYAAMFYCKILEIMLHEIDYLVSSDTSEETLNIYITEKIMKYLDQEKENITNITGNELYDIIVSWFKQSKSQDEL